MFGPRTPSGPETHNNVKDKTETGRDSVGLLLSPVSPHEYLYRRVEVLLQCAFCQRRWIESEYKPTYGTTCNQAYEVLGHLAGIFVR